MEKQHNPDCICVTCEDARPQAKRDATPVKCGTCKYFDHSERLSLHRSSLGQCRIRAPRFSTEEYGAFPIVYEADWCGEWSAK